MFAMINRLSQFPSVLVLGDSIAKGIIQNSENKYKISGSNFIDKLNEKLKLKLMNWSSFGATIEKGLAVYRRKNGRLHDTGLSVLEYGGNDCNFDWSKIAERPNSEHQPMTPLKDFIKQYRLLITELKAAGRKVVLLNLPPLVDERFFETVSAGLNQQNIMQYIGGNTFSIYRWQEAYSNAISRIAQAEKLLLVDIRTPFLLQRNYEDFICADGMHPNERGHELIAEAIDSFLDLPFADFPYLN